MNDIKSKPAGSFLSWLDQTRKALVTEGGANVPCGGCLACCKSYYFIHISPDEKEALAVIPKELLVPAPRSPKGNWLLGHYDNGQCPMLINDKCSIYEQRPLTCRRYDCRIFVAADLTIDEENKELINDCLGKWRFAYPTRHDQSAHQAVKTAAVFLQENRELFSEGFVPNNALQLSLLAIKVYPVFMCGDDFVKDGGYTSDEALVQAIIKFRDEFED